MLAEGFSQGIPPTVALDLREIADDQPRVLLRPIRDHDSIAGTRERRQSAVTLIVQVIGHQMIKSARRYRSGAGYYRVFGPRAGPLGNLLASFVRIALRPRMAPPLGATVGPPIVRCLPGSSRP